MLTVSMTPDSSSDYASPADAALALATMSAADLRRAEMLARVRANGVPGLGWEDLLQEAAARMLEGARRWPRGVPFIAFLAQTMRSIASDARRRDSEEAGLVGDVPSVSPDLDGELDAAREIGRIEALFADDPAVQGLIEGLLAGETALETRERLSLSAQAYDAARKRFWRGVAKYDIKSDGGRA